MNFEDDYNFMSNVHYDEYNYTQLYSKFPILSDLDSIYFNCNNSFNNKNINKQDKTDYCTVKQIENNNSTNKNTEIEESNLKQVKIIGKKREKANYKGVHNKFSEDNLIRTIRKILLNNLTKFINKLIYEVYNGKINQGILKKELKNLNQNQTKKVKENKEFLYKTIKDIFYCDLSNRYTNYSFSHNKNIINELLNEKDEEKRIIFEKIFHLKITDCLNNYKGINNIKEILPLNELINENLNDFKDEHDYFQLLSYYILNFEEIIMRKKSRKGRKNN